MTRAIAIALLCATAAHATPPAVGSEDHTLMAPYVEWIAAQHDAIGRICCDWSDARPVQVRQRDGRWEVQFIHPAELPMPHPVGWQVVPDRSVLRDSDGRAVLSPVGLSIAWWWDGEVRCFTVPGGV